MRSDFIKVLTERPRTGGRDTYGSAGRRQKKIADDDVGNKEGMRRPYRETGDWKEFSDLIGPLHRFLHSRVGKPWNTVHSEICEHLKGRSTQQQHLLDHLKWAVTTDLYVKDGKLWSKPMRFRVSEAEFSRYGGNDDFYVDPRDGILRACIPRRSRWKRRTEPKPPVTEFTQDDHAYKLMDGIWYEVHSETESVRVVNFVTKEGQPSIAYRTQIVERKRQLSTNELKGLGIKNAT